MKFKTFVGLTVADVEGKINAWLSQGAKTIVINSGSCAMVSIPGPFVTVTSVLVSVFYEDENPN